MDSPRADLLAHLARLASLAPARALVEQLRRDPTPPSSLAGVALPLDLLDEQLRLAGLDDAELATFREAGLGAPQLEAILYAHREALHAQRLLAALGSADHERVSALLDGCPLPFGARRELAEMVSQLGEALRDSLGEIPSGVVRLIGTSATLFSLNPGKSPDHRFDDVQRSDLDLAIESAALSRWLVAQGATIEWSRINAGGTLLGLPRWLPVVGAWQARWSASLGRPVGVVATGDGGPRRWPSMMDVAVSLRGEPCQARRRG